MGFSSLQIHADSAHRSYSLEQLGKTLLEKGPQKLEPSPKRIRVLFNKIYIVDTTSAKCVWEHPYYPQYGLTLLCGAWSP